MLSFQYLLTNWHFFILIETFDADYDENENEMAESCQEIEQVDAGVYKLSLHVPT